MTHLLSNFWNAEGVEDLVGGHEKLYSFPSTGFGAL